jgi:N-acylglucosamine 2-epimerase
MNRQIITDLEDQYRSSLLNDIVPFWLRHSPDFQNGGYFTCLDREGRVFDTDKFIWLQARQVWTFANLYRVVDTKAEWLEHSQLGIHFLRSFGRSLSGDWYFALRQDGQPLVEPYNIFSDCFAALAFAAYGRAAGDADSTALAKATYRRILFRKENPKGRWEKRISIHRPLKNLALPMILCNLTTELEDLLDKEEVERTIDWCLDEVMGQFLDQERNIVFENILPGGRKEDCFDGRLINPGHGLEAMWFILDISRRRGDVELRNRAASVILSLLDFGWDNQNGGIFYFLDSEGHPPQQLEWDQKLWWVHLESLVATIMAFRETGDQKFWDWFLRIHEYTWKHFPDPDFGEWFGYLNRQGEVLLPLKGGKWKGCFHLPRALLYCYHELANIR